jgi:rhodanese-related sulfurtransferase
MTDVFDPPTGADPEREIAPDRLRARLGGEDDPDLRIVDVRSPAAFAEGAIPGSENVPFERLPGSVERFDGAEEVVTVCPHGEVSLGAARLIGAYEGVGGPVRSLAGGLAAWDGPLVDPADG